MTFFLLCSIIYLQLYAPKTTYLLPVVSSVSNCIHTDCVKEKPVKLWSLKNGLMLGEWWFADLLGIHSDVRGMTLCQCYDVLKVESYCNSWYVYFRFIVNYCEFRFLSLNPGNYQLWFASSRLPRGYPTKDVNWQNSIFVLFKYSEFFLSILFQSCLNQTLFCLKLHGDLMSKEHVVKKHGSSKNQEMIQFGFVWWMDMM
jgi:hypothetical protein